MTKKSQIRKRILIQIMMEKVRIRKIIHHLLKENKVDREVIVYTVLNRTIAMTEIIEHLQEVMIIKEHIPVQDRAQEIETETEIGTGTGTEIGKGIETGRDMIGMIAVT